MEITIERAAIAFANKCRTANIKGGLDYPYDELDMRNAFEAGVEWAYERPKNPWISVKDRLPNENDIVLCRMVSNGAIVSGYIFISPDNYVCVSTLPDFEFEDYGGYMCDMWMPIPSFDEKK